MPMISVPYLSPEAVARLKRDLDMTVPAPEGTPRPRAAMSEPVFKSPQEYIAAAEEMLRRPTGTRAKHLIAQGIEAEREGCAAMFDALPAGMSLTPTEVAAILRGRPRP